MDFVVFTSDRNLAYNIYYKMASWSTLYNGNQEFLHPGYCQGH